MTRIAILHCGKLPSFVTWDIPNLEELFEEDYLLLQGFEAQEFEAEPVVWNRPAIDWNQYDIALIRSTWDYLDEREEVRLQAQAVLDRLTFDILYARLDLVRIGHHLAVIEVELIEPIFSFNLVPAGITRLVNAVKVKFESHS